MTLKNVIDIILKTHSQFRSTFSKEDLKFIQTTNYEDYFEEGIETVELNPSFSFEQCPGGFNFIGTLLYYMDSPEAKILNLVVTEVNSTLKHGKIITQTKEEMVEANYSLFIAWELVEKDPLHYKEFLEVLDTAFYEYGKCAIKIQSLSKKKPHTKSNPLQEEISGLYDYLAELEKDFIDDDDESDCN